jgi:hypothetical protein
MKLPRMVKLCVPAVALSVAALSAPLRAVAPPSIQLQVLGTYSTGVFNAGAMEIAAHDPATQRLFVVNASSSTVDVLDVQDPTNPTLLFAIDLTPYGNQANSVAVHNGFVACAVEADVKQDPGRVVFFSTNGHFVNQVTVGALPDMLTYTPNGRYVLVANEGEPNDSYTVDPEGSVSIIDLHRGPRNLRQSDVKTAGFTSFNGTTLDPSVRVYGANNPTVAQDFEPEYIAVSSDSKTAWVTLQENNAIAIVGIGDAAVRKVVGLGFKNHALPENAFDASDRDGPSNGPKINITTWPVFGIYEPDAIATYRFGGRTWLVTANEGDTRAYSGLNEESRVSSLALDPTAFPNGATLKQNANLGRLTVTNRLGNPDNDSDFDALYVPGGRSFSIRDDQGSLVYDSGDDFEQITALANPTFFNSNNDANDFDSRSDNKGPEPEGVTVHYINERTYAFIGLERVGGIMVYDVTNPASPSFVQFLNNRDFTGSPAAGTAKDLGPEGLLFISAANSPTGQPLLVVSNEISGTATIYAIVTV